MRHDPVRAPGRHCLDQRDQYLASSEVDWLTLQTGKGTGG
jgi:hypothetical protein